MLNLSRKTTLPKPEQALPGRERRPFVLAGVHTVLGTPIEGEVPAGLEEAIFAFGCFWGAEEIFWQLPGVWATAVGYAGGFTPNPTYEEVCSGRTGHSEAVRVVFDPSKVTYQDLLKVFWESHDPTQGMRQGNDVGTQYRSAIYYTSQAQRAVAQESREVYGRALEQAGYDAITTEIEARPEFWYAEDYHQQYLDKNPNGYRCHSTADVPFPTKTG